jgi:hypothetical protein
MKRIISICLVSALMLLPLAARPSSTAVGAQLGFTSTGVVSDFELSPVALNIGANFPAGIAYIRALADGDDWGLASSLLTMTADVCYPISLGEQFGLKVGLGTTLFTNFTPWVLGFAGPVIKGEYWIPDTRFGLFAKLDVPIFIYAIGEGDTATGFSQALPLMGIFTSSIGVLYAL